MPGFCICLWFCIYQGSQYAGVTQGSEYAWIFSSGAFYIIWLIRYQGNLWKRNTSTAKSCGKKVGNCYVVVKHFSPVPGFLACFAHFSLQYNFFVIIRGLLCAYPTDLWRSILETLGDKKLSVEHAHSNTTMIET